MILSKVKLTDSIGLSYISTDRFKSGILSLTIPLPLSAKGSAYAMLLAGILKRGTEKYPDITSLNRRLDELYASSLDIRSARIGKNLALILTADMLDDCYISDECDVLDGLCELCEETLLRPRTENGIFPLSIFEQEKRFLLDSINASVNNTRAYASVRLAEMMLANDEEFPTIEELKEIINGIDSKDLTEYFFNTVLSSPIEAFYIGNTPIETVAGKLTARFSGWKSTFGFTPVLPVAEPLCNYRRISEKMPVSQGKLAMGFKVGVCIGDRDNRHFTAILLNEIFGGSAMSKLFMNVREKLSLCYYCSSNYNQYMGTLTVSSGIDNKNLELVQSAILSELKDICDGKISDAEFHAAKKALENSYKQIYDSAYDLQSFYGNRSFFGFNEEIDIVKDSISKISKEDVCALAKNITLDSVFYVEASGDGEEIYDDEY